MFSRPSFQRLPSRNEADPSDAALLVQSDLGRKSSGGGYGFFMTLDWMRAVDVASRRRSSTSQGGGGGGAEGSSLGGAPPFPPLELEGSGHWRDDDHAVGKVQQSEGSEEHFSPAELPWWDRVTSVRDNGGGGGLPVSRYQRSSSVHSVRFSPGGDQLFPREGDAGGLMGHISPPGSRPLSRHGSVATSTSAFSRMASFDPSDEVGA